MTPEGYYAILYKRKGEVVVEFPDHWNIITSADSWEAAIEAAQEALAIALEEGFERGFVLPEPTRPKATQRRKVLFVPIRMEIRMAYLLREIRNEASLTQAEMARRLGIRTQSYTRMEKPGRSNLRVSTLERIAGAVGKKLVMDFIQAGAE